MSISRSIWWKLKPSGLAVLPVLLAITGCSTTQSTWAARSAVDALARYELVCPQVQLVELGESAELFGVYDHVLGARGCGRRAVYLVSCANNLCQVKIE